MLQNAEQLINGVTMIVIILSFQLPIVRVESIAGTAQATPLINGITDLPFNPNLRISLSIRKLTRAIYPVSSSMAMKVKSNAICGMKITIPPIPARTPFTIKSFNTPLGKALWS